MRGRGTRASAAPTPDDPGGVCSQRPASEATSRAPSAAAPPPARTRQPLGHAGAAAAEQGIERHLPPGPHERAPNGHPREEGAPPCTRGPETQMPTHHPAEQRPATAAPRRPAESAALGGKRPESRTHAQYVAPPGRKRRGKESGWRPQGAQPIAPCRSEDECQIFLISTRKQDEKRKYRLVARTFLNAHAYEHTHEYNFFF